MNSPTRQLPNFFSQRKLGGNERVFNLWPALEDNSSGFWIKIKLLNDFYGQNKRALSIAGLAIIGGNLNRCWWSLTNEESWGNYGESREEITQEERERGRGDWRWNKLALSSSQDDPPKLHLTLPRLPILLQSCMFPAVASLSVNKQEIVNVDRVHKQATQKVFLYFIYDTI